MSKKILIIFYEWGPYHWARVRAARLACDQRGWQLFTAAIVDQDLQHPWGWTEESNLLDGHIVLINEREQKEFNSKKINNIINKKLSKHLRLIKPDVIFIPGWGFSWTRYLILSCKSKAIKAVLMTESKKDDKQRVFLMELLKSFFVKKTQAALVSGKRAIDYVQKLSMNPQKIFLAYDVVDND